MMIKSLPMRCALFAFCLMLFSSLACSLADFTAWVAEPGSVLFSDDFSNSASGWTRVANEGGTVGYDSGVFRILVNAPFFNYWATPGLDLEDVRLEVDAGRHAGPIANRIGLVCRYQDDKNYYFFAISSDGFYTIGKVSDGATVPLGQEQMQGSPAIKTDDPVNHLRADCIGDTLTFFVNGFPVALVHDEQFARGDVGLLAGTFEETGVDILFDNFVVIKP